VTSLPCFARRASCLINHQHTSRQRFSGQKACERRTVMSGIGTGVSARSVVLTFQAWVIEGSLASMYSWYAVRSVSFYFLPGRKGVPDRLRAESSRQQRVRSCFWPELLQSLCQSGKALKLHHAACRTVIGLRCKDGVVLVNMVAVSYVR